MTTKEFDIAVTTFVEQFRTRALLDALGIRSDGGPGSGNFGHAGNPGHVGGSAPGNGTAIAFRHISKSSFTTGSDDFEVTQNVRDCYLTNTARTRIESTTKSVKTAKDLERYLSKRGIKVSTSTAALRDKRWDDEIPAVKQQIDFIITAVEQYEDIGGLGAVKEVHFYEDDMEGQGGYIYRAKGEGDVPDEGHIYLSRHATGFQVLHEFAHAYADSTKPKGMDVVEWSAKLNRECGIDSSEKGYFGQDHSAAEAERFANAIGGAIAYGDTGRNGKARIDFLVKVSNKVLESKAKRDDGGPGSGNFGHKGVEGQVGGSAPSGGSKNSYKAPETQMEKYALQDNDSATGFLMREGMGWKEAVALHDSGKALDKAKEIIDKRHKEQEARYEHASEGQKKLMRMSADTADKFVQECYKKPVDESLNRGSKTQHVVSELGIDSKPTVLGREAFEKAVAESPSGVIYRGVTGSGNLTAEEICKLTIESDKQYVGNGFHGDGTYFSTRLGTAAGYTHNPDGVSTGLMTACLSPDARIIDSRTLGAAYNDFQISDASTRALYMGYNVIAHEANRFADGTVEMYYITLDRSALCFLDEHQDTADDGKKVIDGQALADVWNAFAFASDEERMDDDWVTIRGTHVMIDEHGVAQGGGKLKGMTFSNAKTVKKAPKYKRPEAQDKVLKKIAKRTANLKKEQSRIVDKDGKVLLEKKGDRSSVSYTVGEKREFMTGNISIHNHPDGGTFSAADLGDFGFGAREIMVSSPEGTYTLTNEKFDAPERYEGWGAMRDALEREIPERSAFDLLKQARENLKGSSEAQEMSRISETWVKMKDSGASREELDDYYRKSGYDDLNRKQKENVEKETRRLEVQPFHEFYTKNAGKYGFKYSFEPSSRKDGMTDSIGRKPMFSYARLSYLFGMQ